MAEVSRRKFLEINHLNSVDHQRPWGVVNKLALAIAFSLLLGSIGLLKWTKGSWRWNEWIVSAAIASHFLSILIAFSCHRIGRRNPKNSFAPGDVLRSCDAANVSIEKPMDMQDFNGLCDQVFELKNALKRNRDEFLNIQISLEDHREQFRYLQFKYFNLLEIEKKLGDELQKQAKLICDFTFCDHWYQLLLDEHLLNSVEREKLLQEDGAQLRWANTKLHHEIAIMTNEVVQLKADLNAQILRYRNFVQNSSES